MIRKKNPKALLNHFLQIPVLAIFSEKFPYHQFLLKKNQEQSSFELPDTILGKQAEAIFEHIVSMSRNYKLLAANSQIQSAKITIGELDYLVEDISAKEFIHVEVACKFYLYDENIENTFEGKWVGSNRKDTLLDKLNKLKNKQFPLLHRPELAPILNDLEIEASQIKQQHYILSSLYIPITMDIKLLPKPYQECIVGRWMLFSDFKVTSKSLYAIPSKKEWLLPNKYIDIHLESEDALAKVSKSISNKRAVQVYEKTDQQIIKYFVVWW